MKRRKFFAFCLSCLIGGFGGVVWLLRNRVFRVADQTDPAERLRQHFWYLTIDRQDLKAFADDHLQRFGPIGDGNFSRVAMCFLMSTDFFPRADESLPVKYTGLYDPESGSENPFARSL